MYKFGVLSAVFPFSFWIDQILFLIILHCIFVHRILYQVHGPKALSGHHLSTIQPPGVSPLCFNTFVRLSYWLSIRQQHQEELCCQWKLLCVRSNAAVGDRVSAWRVFRTVLPPMPLVLVSLHVQGKVVGPGEGAWADGALEGLGACVLPVMARQLIWASEAPVTAVPRAPVWLLTYRGGEGKRKMPMSSQRGKTELSFLPYKVLQHSVTMRSHHNDDTDYH